MSSLSVEIDSIVGMPDREEAYLALAKRYLDGSEEEQRYIAEKWDFGVTWKYPNQARLACKKGEHRSSRERLEASLAYYAISAQAGGDPRDVLVALAVIYHSCKAAGLDPATVFKKVAKVSPKVVQTLLNDFLARADTDKSLAAFSLVEVRNNEGETEIRPSWISASS